jgi:hypothetical protein
MRLYGKRRSSQEVDSLTTETVRCEYWNFRLYSGLTADSATPCGVCKQCRDEQRVRESFQAALRPYTKKED